MALTGRVKLLRVLSLIQCWMALWFVVLGIVERVRVKVSFVGFPIWTGILIGITGAIGVQMTFKRQWQSLPSPMLPPVLLMTFMGFSLTCAALCGLSISNYSVYLSWYAGQSMKMYGSVGDYSDNKLAPQDFDIQMDPKSKEEHAMIGSIFAFTVVELLLSLWSVAACLISDQKQLPTSETCEVLLMSADGREADPSRGTAYRRDSYPNDTPAQMK